MLILGISCFYHDAAAALVRDGVIVAAAQEERFTRRKHDPSFPRQAIDYCLHEAGVSPGDLDLVVFYDKPLLKFERILQTYIAYAPRGIKSFLLAMPLWLKEKLWMGNLIRDELAGFDGELLFTEHHESHAASAFFPSPFEEAAIFTADGVGEWATSSFGIGRGNKLEILAEQHFPHSLGLLYSAFTYFTGFKVNSAEYKVMGLAPYGTPRFTQTILSELMDLKEDGSFRLNMRYFNYCAGLTMTSDAFDGLFGGPPRRPESPLTAREMDLARSLQEVTEMVMLRSVTHIFRRTGLSNLCLAGGVALNCVANGRILREGPFKKLWIQPASGDAGGALGAALFGWYSYLGNERGRSPQSAGNIENAGEEVLAGSEARASSVPSSGSHGVAAGRSGNGSDPAVTVFGSRDSLSMPKDDEDRQQGTLLGPSYSREEIEEFLKTTGAFYRLYPTEEELLEAVATRLVEGDVLGWFQGRMEFGPRALGARSILGDPRRREMQTVMNVKIKFRESFRPFAPSILREHAPAYFQIDAASPYMLLVADLTADKRLPLPPAEESLQGLDQLKALRSVVPAITHVDYSARLQTVGLEALPRYRKLIQRFYEKTGCPLVINTSFNVRGEPIVCRPREAYRCFLRTGMDSLALGDFLLQKREQPAEILRRMEEEQKNSTWKKEFTLD